MSAYGSIARPTISASHVASTAWKVRPLEQSKAAQYVIIQHITLAMAPPDLVSVMYEEFADEIDRGNTYPQEVAEGTRYTRSDFEAYYFGADVMLGLRASEDDLTRLKIDTFAIQEEYGLELSTDATIEAVRNVRSWQECIAGFYYVRLCLDSNAFLANQGCRSSQIIQAGARMYARIHSRSDLVTEKSRYPEDLQRWVRRALLCSRQRLRARSCAFLSSLWPKTWLPSERIQSCIRE